MRLKELLSGRSMEHFSSNYEVKNGKSTLELMYPKLKQFCYFHVLCSWADSVFEKWTKTQKLELAVFSHFSVGRWNQLFKKQLHKLFWPESRSRQLSRQSYLKVSSWLTEGSY